MTEIEKLKSNFNLLEKFIAELIPLLDSVLSPELSDKLSVLISDYSNSIEYFED